MKYYILDKIFKYSCSVPAFESLGQATGLGQKYTTVRLQTAKLSEPSGEHLGLSLGLSAHLGSYSTVRRLGKTEQSRHLHLCLLLYTSPVLGEISPGMEQGFLQLVDLPSGRSARRCLEEDGRASP